MTTEGGHKTIKESGENSYEALGCCHTVEGDLYVFVMFLVHIDK